jgi:large conductance mechanosensitive channel
MLNEFKKFAMRGNVVDMAVGIILGGAFGLIAKTLVSDVLMPPIGMLLGGVDFSNVFSVLKAGAEAAGPYATLADAQAARAVTINWGVFVNTVINFLIVAFAVFLVVRGVNRLQTQEKAAPKPPPKQEVLLEEIRDLLQARS